MDDLQDRIYKAKLVVENISTKKEAELNLKRFYNLYLDCIGTQYENLAEYLKYTMMCIIYKEKANIHRCH